MKAKVKTHLYRLAGAAGIAASLPAAKALAIDYNTDTTSTAVSTATGTGLAVGILVVIAVLAVIGLAFLIFWIFMLVDAFQRTNWRDDSQKTTWLVVLIVGFLIGLHWLAAIIYYFAELRARVISIALL